MRVGGNDVCREYRLAGQVVVVAVNKAQRARKLDLVKAQQATDNVVLAIALNQPATVVTPAGPKTHVVVSFQHQERARVQCASHLDFRDEFVRACT